MRIFRPTSSFTRRRWPSRLGAATRCPGYGYVTPAHRGRGVGSELLQRAERI
ncbi:MAG: GNAT family N-acetyltransferase, partial [Spirochaetota bacterium]